MKTSLFNILVILILIGVALPMVGGTMATWSDSETMEGNYIETGSLDILVAECDANWENPGLFNDDLPWGVGLESCFNIPEAELGMTYPCYRLLWNAGCVDGTAYLHIKDVAHNQLASNTYMHIWYDDDGDPETPLVPVWYDDDGDPETPLVPVESNPIADLDCHQIKLGPLPAEAERQLKLKIRADEGATGDILSFDIAFELVQLELCGPTYAWADTEKSPNELTLPLRFEGCTPGSWKNHLLSIGKWDDTPFSPGQTVVSVFSEADAYPDLNGDTFEDTLLDALNFGGGDDLEGAARILLRAAVAAVLNAAHPDVNYPISTATEVIDEVNAALASDRDTMLALEAILDGYNKLGSPF